MNFVDRLVERMIQHYRQRHPEAPPSPGWEVAIVYDTQGNALPEFDSTFKVQLSRDILASARHAVASENKDTNANTVIIAVYRGLRDLDPGIRMRVHRVEIHFVPATATTLQIVYDPSVTQPLAEIDGDNDDWVTVEIPRSIVIDSYTKEELAQYRIEDTFTVIIGQVTGKHARQNTIEGDIP